MLPSCARFLTARKLLQHYAKQLHDDGTLFSYARTHHALGWMAQEQKQVAVRAAASAVAAAPSTGQDANAVEDAGSASAGGSSDAEWAQALEQQPAAGHAAALRDQPTQAQALPRCASSSRRQRPTGLTCSTNCMAHDRRSSSLTQVTKA